MERLRRLITEHPALIAVGLFGIWFLIQLGPYVGEPPDFDPMVAFRESLIVKRDGFGALVDQAPAGIHPPGLDLVAAASFILFGEDWRSESLVAIGLFIVIVIAVVRLLSPWLSPGLRVLAAVGVAICPSLAIAVFLMSREGLMLAVLAVGLMLAFKPEESPRRGLFLGLVLALMPLIKETGLLLAAPFGLYWAWVGPKPWKDRVKRFVIVFGPVVAAAILWRIVLELLDAKPWESNLLTEHAEDGSYRIGIGAMFGREGTLFLRQNLANGLIVNWLWLPAALALVTIGLSLRKSTPKPLRRAVALLAGLGFIYAWTTLTFPTYTVPRYAAPLTLFAVLTAMLGLPLYKPWLRPVVLGALVVSFMAGAWATTDPISTKAYDTVSIGGEEIYNTNELNRGPDRMLFNLAILRADRRLNARLRRLYASDATMATGDCNALKVGEKLYSIGLVPTAYDRELSGARPLPCVPFDQLPPDAGKGADRIAVLRTPEEEANGIPVPITGPSVIVVR
jgi:MFS family permease